MTNNNYQIFVEMVSVSNATLATAQTGLTVAIKADTDSLYTKLQGNPSGGTGVVPGSISVQVLPPIYTGTVYMLSAAIYHSEVVAVTQS